MPTTPYVTKTDVATCLAAMRSVEYTRVLEEFEDDRRAIAKSKPVNTRSERLVAHYDRVKTIWYTRMAQAVLDAINAEKG